MARHLETVESPTLPHVELFKGSGLQPWRFRLVGANGETMAQSEGYVSRWNARRSARRAFPSFIVVDGF